MGVSKVDWTHYTFNPWIGCARESTECRWCYAEAGDRRFGNINWGRTRPRRITSGRTWAKPRQWNRHAEHGSLRFLVFCASYADVFEDHPGLDDARARLWRLVGDTPHLVWQLLTKRPQNITRMVPAAWLRDWPAHVWVGASAGVQRSADRWIPHLLQVPTTNRFLSCEPLLDRVDVSPWLGRPSHAPPIRWIITGGESGPHARPMDLAWAADLAYAAQQADVPFFFKQLGTRLARQWRLSSAKGNDPAEWPPNPLLFRREFPKEMIRA